MVVCAGSQVGRFRVRSCPGAHCSTVCLSGLGVGPGLWLYLAQTCAWCCPVRQTRPVPFQGELYAAFVQASLVMILCPCHGSLL